MIFGFNTDVKCGDLVYHVQSEARQRELLLQTQVFLHGRCLGKRTSPYGKAGAEGEISSEEMQALLRAQHKEVVDLVRDSKVELAISVTSQERSDTLTLEWLNPEILLDGQADGTELRFAVSKNSAAVKNARVTLKLECREGPQYLQSCTTDEGTAVIAVACKTAFAPEQDTLEILAQATFDGMVATRKYRLRRAP